MLNLKSTLAAATAILVAGPAIAAPECPSDWRATGVPIEGLVFGVNGFEMEITDGLNFTLVPDDTGWRAQMVDGSGNPIPTRPAARGIAPVRGQNDPSMAFAFGPDVLDPALNPELTVPGSRPPNIAAVEPRPGKQGNGWFTIPQQGFTDANPPRRIYMEFEGCIMWNDGPRQPDVSQYASPEDLVNFPSWVVTAFEDCGLPDTLLLSGRMPRPGYRQRAWLEPDIDGDGEADLVALVDRPEDAASGLAICQRDGKRLTLLGLGGETDDQPLSSDFLAEIDWWSAGERSVSLGIEGASSQNVFMDKSGAFASKWVGD